MGFRAVVLGIGALVVACANRTSYPCVSSDQCVSGGRQGVCATGGYCAFADPACESGQRYEPNAGGGLAGECTTNSNCVQQIVFGRRFSCTLHANSTVWCAGQNNRGQLGIGIRGEISTPEPTQVRDDSSAFITDAIALGAGRDFACVIRADKTVWCWGANDDGQLGMGDLGDRSAAQQVITTADTPLANVAAVGGGEDFTCARDDSGGVWCWGENAGGQLGDGTVGQRSKAAPVLVADGGAAFTGALDLAVGGGHTCVHKDGDDIYCWGVNDHGQIGIGTEVNQLVPLKTYTAPQLALGRWHTCAVNADSTVHCWGNNEHARLGIGVGQSFSGEDVLAPTPVLEAPGGAPFSGVKSLAAGAVTCALMEDTSVQCWSDSPYGQTGTGAGSTVPVPVTTTDGKPLTGVAELVADHAHVCARRTSGELLCWGRNLDGDLGVGTFLNRGHAAPLVVSCP